MFGAVDEGDTWFVNAHLMTDMSAIAYLRNTLFLIGIGDDGNVSKEE